MSKAPKYALSQLSVFRAVILNLIFAILMILTSAGSKQAFAQSPVADTAKSQAVADTLPAPVPVAAKDTIQVPARPRFTTVADSLIFLLYRDRSNNREKFPDRPQWNADWQANPALYRYSTMMWGDFESFYAYGLAPGYLSRSDNFVGELSFANPVPLALSEEFIRSEPSDRFFVLSPAISGLYVPFGRVADIHQQSDLAEFDTAASTIYVNRARGGFANTTFEFKSNFGNLGSLRTDGTFQKSDGLVIGSNTNLRRMRVLLEPRLGGKWRGNVLYSFNRLQGSKIFFPDNYSYDGNVSDYFANLATSLCYLRSERTQLDWRSSYRNDAQYFNKGVLATSQRFRIVESSTEYQIRSERSTVGVNTSLRFLRFISQHVASDAFYFDFGARELFTLSPRTKLFGSAAIIGSTDLAPRPSVVGAVVYDLDSSSTVSVTGAWRTILPQPEMLYLAPISAALFDSVADYSISGDPDLGAGTARSIEFAYQYSHERAQFRISAGAANLANVAEWRVNSDSLLYGETLPIETDHSILYAGAQGRFQPTNRVAMNLSYGIRKANSDGSDVTLGPKHTAAGSAWYGFPVKRFKLWINFGAGATFRSAVNRQVYGGVEDGVVIAESYFSFDLKRFHFYFNYHNVFDVAYTMAGIEQPGRSIWWGFRWKFID